MNPRYSALLQLVDYPDDPRHIAAGDLVCVDGKWSAVTEVKRESWGPAVYVSAQWGNSQVQVWKHNPVARIPGPLLALLEAAKDPYR